MELKLCSICKIEKSIDDFYKVKGKYRFPYCRDCSKQKNSEWKRANRERRNLQERLWKLGISAEEYNKLMESANGRCQICDKETDILCIDHCHSSSRIRGMLCVNCNHGLGKFGDDPNNLQAAIRYLQKANMTD